MNISALLSLASILAIQSPAVNCTNAPVQIGSFLGLYQDRSTGAKSPAMAADVMKLTNTGHPDSLLGWLFVDQFGHTWIEATDARAIHVTGATKPFMSELAGNHTVVFMPPSVLLDPKSVDVLHCDEVTTY